MMGIVKNFFNNIFKIVMNIKEKIKDNLKATIDLQRITKDENFG